MTLVAAFALASKIAEELQRESPVLDNPQAIADLLREQNRTKNVETFQISNGGTPLGDEKGVNDVRGIPHAGFAVLHICFSYFETIGQYQQINPKTKKSTDFFKEGVHAVFTALAHDHKAHVDEFLKTLYKKARCGLYHI